jgi:hypothetical protein
MVRVRSHVDAAGNLEILARLVEGFFPKENFTNKMGGVIDGSLWVNGRARVYETALGQSLGEEQ